MIYKTNNPINQIRALLASLPIFALSFVIHEHAYAQTSLILREHLQLPSVSTDGKSTSSIQLHITFPEKVHLNKSGPSHFDLLDGNELIANESIKNIETPINATIHCNTGVLKGKISVFFCTDTDKTCTVKFYDLSAECSIVSQSDTKPIVITVAPSNS